MTGKDARLAVVTGASRGIGHALAEALTAQGWDVLSVSRTGGGSGRTLACDLAAPEGRGELLETLRQGGRPVGLFVNNAGVQRALDFAIGGVEVVDAARAELALNLLAPVALTARIVPLMQQPGGVIVNVTSLVALHPKGSAPVYSASKAGLASFTRAMRLQLAPLGLRVVEVVPPLVATDMTEGRNAGAITAEAVAMAVVEGVAAGRDLVAPGKAAMVLRLNHLLPGFVARRIGAM